MGTIHGMKQRIIDEAIEALQGAGDDSTIDVRLEGSRIVIIINTAGGGARSTAPKRPGRPSVAAKPAALGAPDGATAKVLAVLNEEKHHRGLNLVGLTKAIGMNKNQKSSLRPVIEDLVRAKELTQVGRLFRRADVDVRRGRKAAPRRVDAAQPRTARAAKPVKEAPAGDETFTHGAVAAILRDHSPGYSMVELTKKLGAPAKAKMALKPVLAQMMKTSGADQVEKKGPFYRLKNLERKRGRKPAAKQAAPKQPAAPGKRGPGRPKGSKNTSVKTEAPAQPAKRGPGRPKGSKKAAPRENAPARPKKEESLSALIKAARDRAKNDLAKVAGKSHKPSDDHDLDDSGQPKRELTRVPIEDEEKNEDGAE